GMSDAADEDPGPRAADLEEGDVFFPPRLPLRAERLRAPARIGRVSAQELETRFRLWQRRRGDVEAEHGLEPGVLADALVDHVLAHAAPAAVGRMRAEGEVRVLELRPHAQDLQALGLIGLDEERVAHAVLLGASRGA